jgi:hemolysin III
MSSVAGDALERCHAGGRREPVNGWFHFAGALLACVGLMPLIREANERDSIRHLVGASVFGATSFLMFSASALYHLRPASPRQRLYQRLDHAMIYLFIAGTYTPVCLITLWPGPMGVVLLASVWALAATGMLLDLTGRPLRRGQATAFYLAMGWAVLPVAPALREHPGLGAWLLIGGIFYTGGAIAYLRQRPRRRLGPIGFHELWHLCVLAASASHFWAIFAYVLAQP